MINVAIIGLGYWGPNFARVINESGQGKLVWCCDLAKKNLLTLKAQYKNSQITTNFRDVLQDKTVDAVVVAVPAAEHYKIAKQALLAEKDVLVEKPLAVSQEEAKGLIKLSKSTKRILMVDHIFLFNPAIRKIKELIDKNYLEKIFYGHGTYTALGPIRIDVSAMWDLSIHFLYTICYLLGEYPISISAFGRGFLVPKNADVAFLNLEFGKKTIFNLKVSWLALVKTRSLVLVGDEKMVIFDDTRVDKVTLLDRGVNYGTQKTTLPERYRFIFRYGDVVLPYIPEKEPLKGVFDNFLISIKTRTPSFVNLLDAVNVITILEAAEYSLRHKGVKVDLRNNKRTGILSFRKGK